MSKNHQVASFARLALRSCIVLFVLAPQFSLAAEQHRSGTAKWHITETANIRLLNYGTASAPPELAERLERLRTQLAEQWLGDASRPDWQPKCHIVFHPSDSSYFREVGAGGRQTAASALVDRTGDRIHLRRIDIRPCHGLWDEGAVAHEMSHVVLADHFLQHTLPRWIDEGMAILADDPAKRRNHWNRSAAAVTAGAHFRLPELFALVDYPAPARWGVFYDQSGALVEYLVAEGGHARFLAFVDLALTKGYGHAVEVSYGLTLDELEQKWRRAVTTGRGVPRPADALSRIMPVSTAPQG